MTNEKKFNSAVEEIEKQAEIMLANRSSDYLPEFVASLSRLIDAIKDVKQY